ncbi:hypothetical protein ACH5RR_013456 [Cinchona calisaya]|uniref:RNase H type-1 domain-containing protein n=1 Tax=Cinchona calisaya TaxID=153742 RepID=A0ABD3A064_9GENT
MNSKRMGAAFSKQVIVEDNGAVSSQEGSFGRDIETEKKRKDARREGKELERIDEKNDPNTFLESGDNRRTFTVVSEMTKKLEEVTEKLCDIRESSSNGQDKENTGMEIDVVIMENGLDSIHRPSSRYMEETSCVPSRARWVPPLVDYLKINSGIARNNTRGTIGIRVVGQDYDGKIVAIWAMKKRTKESKKAEMAEAVKLALIIALEKDGTKFK